MKKLLSRLPGNNDDSSDKSLSITRTKSRDDRGSALSRIKSRSTEVRESPIVTLQTSPQSSDPVQFAIDVRLKLPQNAGLRGLRQTRRCEHAGEV